MTKNLQAVKRRGRWAIVAVLLGSATACLGQAPEEKGRLIAEEASRRSAGYGDTTARLRMVLRNRQGQVSERELRVRSLEVEGGTRSLCIFDAPPDVKDTILLTHTHKVQADDQWLYLPAEKRVRRIAAQNKSGSFVGSEFSYEDLASPVVEKYTYLWLRDEALDGQECFVVERRPKDGRSSGYVREVAWLDKQEYRMLKVDYYDRKDSLLKTLTLKDYRKYLDRFWRPHDMAMTNLQTGKSSQLIWSDVAFHTGLTENDFSQASLSLIR
jgi:outer membrane lipoprotein-sorting protein